MGDKVVIGDGQFYPSISDIQHWQTNHIRWERERERERTNTLQSISILQPQPVFGLLLLFSV
jgi:hypothetical protein